MAATLRIVFLASSLIAQFSAGISSPQGCEVCDSTLGCLTSSHTQSQSEYNFPARFLTICPDLCTSCDPDECLSCKLNASLISYECVCDTNYFKSNKQCSSCSDLCQTCDPATGCTQCKLNAGEDPSDCSCIPGYRLDNNQCVQCNDPLCDTCSSSGECSICKPHAGSDTSDCTCESGYYPSGDKCVPCDQPLCSECDESGVCTTCSQNAENPSECVCASGYYVHYGECSQCDPLCHSCDRLGCFECKPNAGTNTSSCQCQSGYYIQNNQCIACTNPLCAVCDSSECTQCKSNTNNDTTNCACSSGFYKSGRECVICPSDCTTCQDDLGCTVCNSGHYLYKGACPECPSLCTSCIDESGCQNCKENAGNDSNSCECKIGFFENSNNACEECLDDLCFNCSSAETCEECMPDAELVNGQCECKAGYMEHAGECISCPYLCAECTTEECTACMPNAGTDFEHCDCEIYYFFSDNKCVHCSDLCLACGFNGCNICKDHAIPNNGVCECEEGYYEKDGGCHLCEDSLCSTCTESECTECKEYAGSDPTSCKCAQGYYEHNGECNKCIDSLCESCTFQGCNQCKDNAGDLSDCRCITGYYEDNEVCLRCSPLCADCTTTGCQECKPHAGWDLDNCMCEEGYYEANSHCVACSDILCGECDSDVCLSCSPNAGFVNSECECNSGFYQLENECVEYPALTATVNSIGESVSCVENAELVGRKCVCNAGHYVDSNTCKPCEDSLCDECNYLGCLSCAENAENLDDCMCINGYYEETGVCVQCSSLCKECDPELGCLKCKNNAGSDADNCGCVSNYWFYVNQCIQCSDLCEQCSTSGCTDCKEYAGDDPTNCICQSGYYKNVNQCTACSVTYDLCTECTSSQCTDCVSSAQLSNGLCVCKPHSNNTVDPEACLCNSTHYLNTDETACLECPANSSQSSQDIKTCKCHDGYFMNTEGTACISCSGLCATCSSSTHCLTCKTNSVQDPQNVNQCVCPSSFKLSSSGDACEACQSNSAQSSVDAKVCKCDTGYHLNTGVCVECIVDYTLCNVCSDTECTGCKDNSTKSGVGCVCNSGYYELSNACKVCTDSYNYCLQCNSSQCTECIANSSASGSDCVCNTGYYLNNGVCASCPVLCHQCNSLGVCTQCKTDATDNGSGCECNQGFVASEGKCVACSDSLCLSCTNSGCSQCKTNASDVSNCSCNSGYYESEGSCNVCADSLCDLCNPANICTQCKTNAAGTSDCSCNSGYFESGGSCHACTDSLCDLCNPAESCTQCKTHASNIADCSCEIGYYESGGSCHACDNSLCKTCYPGNTCTECKTNASDSSNCSCDSGYYMSGGSCLACANSLCADCDPDNVCTVCKQYAGDNTNNCSCIEGYYLNNNQCAACPSLCKSCDSLGQCLECKPNAGDDETNCTCIQGYFEENNQCSACHSLCTDCTSTYCNQCVTNSSRLQDTFHCGCNSDYYKMSSACLLKNPLCSSYIDDSGCQSCKSNAGVELTNCVCQNGYYVSSSSCVACSDLCADCNITTGCQSCKPNSGSDSSNCQCIEGYFKSGLECQQCNSLCKACTSLGCSECKENTNGNTAGCLCSAGFYDSDNVCVTCPDLCAECSGEDNCTVCKANAKVVNGACVCDDRYYFDTVSRACVRCNGLCETCSSASSCLSCKSNAGYDPSNCQCQGRYLNVNDICLFQCPDDCASCSATTHECYSCKTGKLYWPEVGVCYGVCPTGYTTSQLTLSGNTLTQCQLSNPFLYSSDFTDLQTTKTSNSIALVGTNTTPQYKRGWYYNGLSYATFQKKIIYGTTFYIEFWVRMDDVITLSTLFSKYYTSNLFHLYIQNSYLHLKLNTESYDASYSTSEKSVSLSHVLLANSWYKFGLVIGLSSAKKSTITLYSNGVQSFSTTLDNGYILDDLLSNSIYVIGAHYISSSSISAYFKGFIGYIKTENGPYTAVQSSSNCVSSNNCLSICDLSYYPSSSSCAPCVAGCTTGCANPDRCSVSTDSLCSSYSNFEVCTGCYTYSYLVSGVCRCVTNSSYESSTSSCKCNTDYTGFNGQCVLCRDYLTPAEVSGAYNTDYTAIILTFSRALTNRYITSCANLFKTDTYTKIGSKSICTFSTDRLKITVTLGADATYTSGELVLNELVIVGEKTTCRTDPNDIKLNVSFTTAPELVAVLEVPASYSKVCGSSSFTIKGEKSMYLKRFNISYSWSATGTAITSALTSFLATQTSKNIIIQPSYLQAGNAVFSLIVSNVVGYSNTATKTISVLDSRLLTVGIDAGQYLAVEYGQSIRLAGFVSNKCDSLGPFTYVWSLTETSNTSFNLNSSVFTQSSNVITLSGSTLAIGYTYKFSVAVSDTLGLTGSNSITIHIKYPNLIAKLNKISGIISTNSDLSLSASSSYDPSGNDLTYTWECYISGKLCVDSQGVTLVFGDFETITINKENLIAESTYSLGVTISTLDGRSATTSINMNSINSAPNSITLDPPPKSSHQLPLVISPDIVSPEGSTFSWQLISGSSTPNNEVNSQVPLLQFSKDVLIEGGTYLYELSIFNPDLIGKATLEITINDGPKAGTFSVEPSSGIELSNRFYYTSDSFYDGDEMDYPLKYSYFYETAEGEVFQLKTASFSNTYSSYLNRFAVQVGVTICDSIPTCLSETASVTVAAASSRMLQDDILAKYNESIEDDEDIPGVTSIFATSGLIDAVTYTEIKATFVNYMATLQNNQFFREIYYSAYKSFLTNDSIITNDEILDYLNTCSEIINNHSDNSLNEAQDLYDIFSTKIKSRSSDSVFIAKAINYMKSIHWSTYTDEGPSNYSSDLVDDTHLNLRVFGEDLLGKTVKIQGLDISCPAETEKALEVFNAYTEIIESEDLPIINFYMSAVGNLDGLNLVLYDEPIAYTVAQDDLKFVFEFPYENTIDATSKTVACYVYSDTNLTWETSECEYELVDSKMKISSQSVGSMNFRVVDIPIVDPDIEVVVDESDDECDVNPAPFVIVGLLFGLLFVGIVVMIFININRPYIINTNINTLETTKNSNKSKQKFKEKHKKQDSPNEISLNLTEFKEIPGEEETQDYPLDYSIQSYLKLHVLIEIFRENSTLYRLCHLFSVFTSMFLGQALIGAIMHSLIDTDDNSNDSFTEIASEYYPDDAKFIFIALGIIIPVALPLRYLVKLDRNEITISALVGSLIVMAGSMIGILLMGVYYCKAAVNRWTLAYLIYVPLELTISEFIIAAVLFVAHKR